MLARAWLLVPVLLFAGLPAFADDPKIEEVDAKGKPMGFKPGLSPRYAIWYDDAGWHFHSTTNTADQTAFTGKIDVIGGKMTIELKDLGGSGGVPKKKAPEAKKGPGQAMETKGYNFSFKVNKGAENNFVFHPQEDVTALTFDLSINGKPAPTDMIFIGAKGAHPSEPKFSLAVTKPAKK
jgi:hypothetical protein